MDGLKKKKLITLFALIALIAVYYMIFMFSADDGESSSAISQKVTKWITHIYYSIFSSGGTGTGVATGVDPLEALVRKAAHVAEYMLVGILSFGIAIMWIAKKKIGILIVMIQLFISAGLDEFHQYFVPGRNASFKDVLIDVIGGVIGIVIVACIEWIYRKKKSAI